MAPMPLEAPQTGALFFYAAPPLENIPPENAAPANDEKGKRIRPGHPDREHDLTTQLPTIRFAEENQSLSGLLNGASGLASR